VTSTGSTAAPLPSELARRLGLTDAVVIGLASMIGAGIFVALGPVAAAAGPWLLLSIVLAAVVAFANATSTAQLSAEYPTSGGSYWFGRERLGEWPGFLAGWSYVVGKVASCAAMALTVAVHAVPEGPWQRPVAVAVVVGVTAVNLAGVQRTAAVARIGVAVVLAVLAAVAVRLLLGVLGGDGGEAVVPGGADGGSSVHGVLQGAALMFFAFAGYARIATMGEEVRDPERTIPRAILLALGTVVVLYGVLAVLLLAVLGSEGLAGSAAPFRTAVEAVGGGPLWVGLVAVGAVVAALGSLLALVAGISRTWLAMARNHDLPHWFSAVHPRTRTPWRAEIAAAVAISVVIAVFGIRDAVAFSSFGVLLYYLVANAAAFTQGPERRRWPRALQVLGMVGCLALVASLPPVALVTGIVVLAAGILYRLVRLSAS
jgi:basic amino acid/polyamine antiporter, APA family